jgi:glycosyltransferase involved in cell wall biosynthesis
VLEALSLGTPVVGYDLGGVGEILARLYPAGLVLARDRKMLVERLKLLLASAPPVPAEPAYPLQRMLDETLALYEALSRTPRSSGT